MAGFDRGKGRSKPERVLFPEHLFSANSRIVVLVIAVPVLDVVAVLIGSRLVQVWMGQIERM